MSELRVAELMSKNVVTLNLDEELSLASEVMDLARVRHLPVVQNGKLVGLVTHRDLLRAQAHLLASLGNSHEETRFVSVTASDMMTTHVKTVTPDTPAVHAAELLLDNKFGCLPVVEDDHLVGILTEADFLTWAMRIIESNEAV